MASSISFTSRPKSFLTNSSPSFLHSSSSSSSRLLPTRSLALRPRRCFLSSSPRRTAAAAAAAPMVFASAATTSETTPGASRKKGVGGFVGEMRAVAMKLHTRDQAREGEKEPDAPPVAKWEPSVQGYLRFLVDSKLVYDTLESIVHNSSSSSSSSSCPWCMNLFFLVFFMLFFD